MALYEGYWYSHVLRDDQLEGDVICKPLYPGRVSISQGPCCDCLLSPAHSISLLAETKCLIQNSFLIASLRGGLSPLYMSSSTQGLVPSYQ